MAISHNELTKGTQVRLVSDPSRTGVIIDDHPLTRRGRRRYWVQFPNIAERIPESDLERLPASRTDPLDLLRAGSLGGPDDLRRALIHVRLTGRLADIIYSIEATNTTFYPYQFKPVLKMLQTPANGMLIADEVGLGKTIEAGLIWTELRVRFNLNRLFVICPASLCEKWKSELAMKIGVDAEICNLTEVYNTLRDKQSARRGFALVSSMQGLRSSRGLNSESSKSRKPTFHQFLKDMEDEDDLIDVLVVDEAHYMRNPETATNHLGRLLRGVSTYIILLSATPVHNHNTDLFSLLRLIDEDMFAQQEYFSEILKANKPLIKARHKLLSGKSGRSKIAKVLNQAKQNHLLSNSKQLDILMSQSSYVLRASSAHILWYRHPARIRLSAAELPGLHQESLCESIRFGRHRATHGPCSQFGAYIRPCPMPTPHSSLATWLRGDPIYRACDPDGGIARLESQCPAGRCYK